MFIEESPRIVHPNVKRYVQTGKGRLFVASDVHGHWSEFDAILASLGFNPSEDLMVIAGDGIDRGPESMKAIDAMAQYPYIMGNHEFNNAFYLHGQMLPWAGTEWFQSIQSETVKHHFSNLCWKLPLAVEVTLISGERIGICHNFSARYGTWETFCDATTQLASTWEHVLFKRDRVEKHLVKRIPDVHCVINGHTSSSEVHALGNVEYIDTGSGKGGHVTIAEVTPNGLKVHSVPHAPTYFYQG